MKRKKEKKKNQQHAQSIVNIHIKTKDKHQNSAGLLQYT